jgi:hypothetical protein
MFPLLNTARVYVRDSSPSIQSAFLRAFNKCLDELDRGTQENLEPEWYIAQFKKWATSSQEGIFMSMLSYHPEEFYPQQIDDMPKDEDFWWGMYEKELWDSYEDLFIDSWIKETEIISKLMWDERY